MDASGRNTWTWIGATVLVAVVATVATGALSTGDRTPGRAQVIMVMAGICLAGSLGGWLIGRFEPTDPAQAVAMGLGVVCIRFLPGLAALAWLQSAGGRLREHGAAEWLLVFYLALLASDILLRIIGTRRDRGGGASRLN